MATTQKWLAAESAASALTIELNSLANNTYSSASSAIDNTTGLYPFIALELNMASITTGSGSPFVAVYFVISLDGTNYTDGGGSTAPPASSLRATFPLRASVAAAQRVVIDDIPLGPYLFKIVALNVAGATLAASGSTIKYSRYYLQSV